MKTRHYARKPAQDVSGMSAKKLLQTRPFQTSSQEERQISKFREESETLTKGFDLTTAQFFSVDDQPKPVLGPALQSKLTISELKDKHNQQETDHATYDVVQQINAPQVKNLKVQRQTELRQSRSGSTSSDNTNIQNEVDSQYPENNEIIQRQSRIARQEQEGIRKPDSIVQNNIGLPNVLKAGIEQLSGYTMADVEVHYNSPKPAQLGAKAYAKGTEIHMGRGQEHALQHEAWHVVQQKQGRVRQTEQNVGQSLNTDNKLEREAHEMGARAVAAGKRMNPSSNQRGINANQREADAKTHFTSRSEVVQLWENDDEKIVRSVIEEVSAKYKVGNPLKAVTALSGMQGPTFNPMEGSTALTEAEKDLGADRFGKYKKGEEPKAAERYKAIGTKIEENRGTQRGIKHKLNCMHYNALIASKLDKKGFSGSIHIGRIGPNTNAGHEFLILYKDKPKHKVIIDLWYAGQFDGDGIYGGGTNEYHQLWQDAYDKAENRLKKAIAPTLEQAKEYKIGAILKKQNDGTKG